jgi:hypothetical protein
LRNLQLEQQMIFGGGAEGGAGLLAETMLEDLTEARREAAEEQVEIEKEKAKEINAIGDSLAKQDLQRIQQHSAEVIRLRDEVAAHVKAGLDITAAASETFFQELMDGEKAAGKNFGANMLKGVGRYAFTKGTADMAIALANAVIMKDPSGIPYAAAEIGIGATLMAGGMVLGQQVKEARAAEAERVAAVRAAERGGGGSTSFAAGGFGGGRGVGGAGGAGTVNIYVNGAVTAAEVGVQINRSLNEARRQGLI